MQITIDTDKDSPAVLSNVARFILMGYGTPAEIGALLAAQAAPVPVPAGAPVADFLPEDDMPPSPIEQGKDNTDAKAASVFGSAAPIPPSPIPLAPGTTAADIPRDSAGVPYDARIHNKARTTKQNGEWKLAKGVDPATVAAVLAEIAPANAAPVSASAPVETVLPLSIPPVPPVPPAPAPAATVALPPVPPVTPSVPAGPATGAVSFREVMKKVTEGQSSGKLTKVQVDAALAAVGFKPDELAPLVMPANVELLKAFNQLIDADLARTA